MSEENVETVNAIWDAVNRGDLDDAAARLAEDFVWDFTSSENPDSGFFRGLDEVRRTLETLLEPWAEYEFFADEYIDAGDQVVRIGGMRATGKGSGAEVTAHGAQVWTFRDGTPISAALYQSKQEAMAALGHTQ